MVLKELVATEATYVQCLDSLVGGFMAFLKVCVCAPKPSLLALPSPLPYQPNAWWRPCHRLAMRHGSVNSLTNLPLLCCAQQQHRSVNSTLASWQTSK